MSETMPKPGTGGSVAVLVGFLLVVFGVAAAGGWFTQSSLSDWYAGLQKPALTPPNIVFPIVWNTLYLLMAVAAWLVWRTAGSFKAAATPLSVFFIQLALNLLWSALFFGLRSPDLGLVEIIPLWVAILATLILFSRVNRLAGLLILPYLLWVSFATYLTASIWLLNPQP